jgi:hypothetical protein
MFLFQHLPYTQGIFCEKKQLRFPIILVQPLHQFLVFQNLICNPLVLSQCRWSQHDRE